MLNLIYFLLYACTDLLSNSLNVQIIYVQEAGYYSKLSIKGYGEDHSCKLLFSGPQYSANGHHGTHRCVSRYPLASSP